MREDRSRRRSTGRDGRYDRAVSVNVGYTLNLVIMTVIFVGLITAAGTAIDSERRGVASSELDVAGNQLATALSSVDRVARVAAADTDDEQLPPDATPTVRKSVRLPDRIVGGQYRIRITEETIELAAVNDAVSVTVPYRTELPIEGTTGGGEVELRGGDVEIVYLDDGAGGDGSLEVRSA
ncbi:MAG: DUF7266 family protein [Halobacteriota archaeon]